MEKHEKFEEPNEIVYEGAFSVQRYILAVDSSCEGKQVKFSTVVLVQPEFKAFSS